MDLKNYPRYSCNPFEEGTITVDKSLKLKKSELKLLLYLAWNASTYARNGYQTHNHLLIRGEGVKDAVNIFLTSRNLVDPRFVKYEEYDPKLGATHYVVKYINSEDVSYGIY